MKTINLIEMWDCELVDTWIRQLPRKHWVQLVGIRDNISQKPIKIRIKYSDFCWIAGYIKQKIDQKVEDAVNLQDKLMSEIDK